MLLSVLGRITSVMPVQPSKAPLVMVVTPSGISIRPVWVAGQRSRVVPSALSSMLFLVQKLLLPSATSTDDSLVQPLKTLVPNSLSEAGRVMLFRLVQPLKAEAPTLVMPSNRCTDSKMASSSNALSAMLGTVMTPTAVDTLDDMYKSVVVLVPTRPVMLLLPLKL